MFSTIGYVLLALLLLSVLIFFHELGHFLVGRLTGMAIVEFSMGFGPKLLSFSRKGTLYSLRLLPLGGYCRFYGEDEDEKDEKSFNARPAWRRFLTVLAGPATNVLLALLLVVLVLTAIGEKEVSPLIASVNDGEPAQQAGLQEGDTLLAVNGQFSDDYYQLRTWIQQSVQGEMDLTVLRDGQRISFPVQGQYVQEYDAYTIGATFTIVRVTYGFFESCRISAQYCFSMLLEMFKSLRLLFQPSSGSDIMGPVGTVSLISSTAQTSFNASFLDGVDTMLRLGILISLNLGLINILPLPALDGGRLVFLSFEMVFRRALPRKIEGVVHMIGLALLFGLMIFISVKDVANLFA